MVDLDGDGVDPYLQLQAMMPFDPPTGDAACAQPQPEFDGMEQQQAAFDDDPNTPTIIKNLDAVRAVCARCPLLSECAAYAQRSCVEDGVLAGMTAAERRSRRRKRDLVALRDRQVHSLAALEVSATDMAELLGVDVTAIRRHLRGAWSHKTAG